MKKITIYTANSSINKHYTLENNVVNKNSKVTHVYPAHARTVSCSSPDELKQILKRISSNPNKCIGLGVFKGSEEGDEFSIVTVKALKAIKEQGEVPEGVVTKTKDSMEQGGWMLFDKDNDTDMQLWIEEMNRLIEDFDSLAKVIIPSNSARAGVEGKSNFKHIYVPQDTEFGIDGLEGFGRSVLARADELGLVHFEKSKGDSELRRTIFDATVFSPERVIFDGEPVILPLDQGPVLPLDDAVIDAVDGDGFSRGGFTASLQQGGLGSSSGVGYSDEVVHDVFTADMLIEVKCNGIARSPMTLQQIVDEGLFDSYGESYRSDGVESLKLKCQVTPFVADSKSWNGGLFKKEGRFFIKDFGRETRYEFTGGITGLTSPWDGIEGFEDARSVVYVSKAVQQVGDRVLLVKSERGAGKDKEEFPIKEIFDINYQLLAEVLETYFYQKGRYRYVNHESGVIDIEIKIMAQDLMNRTPFLTPRFDEMWDTVQIKAYNHVLDKFLKLEIRDTSSIHVTSRDNSFWIDKMTISKEMVEGNEGEKRLKITTPFKMLYDQKLINPRVIDDFNNHFTQFEEIVRFVVACRFSSQDRHTHLWVRANAGFGKSFLIECLKRLLVSVEGSDIKRAYRGEPSGLSEHTFDGKMGFVIDEFDFAGKDLKKVNSTIIYSPKGKSRVEARVYCKLYMSTEEVPTLASQETGVETQFSDRFAHINIKGEPLEKREIFDDIDMVDYFKSIKAYVAKLVNDTVDAYVAMGVNKSGIESARFLQAFHKKYHLNHTYSPISETIDDVVGEVVRLIYAGAYIPPVLGAKRSPESVSAACTSVAYRVQSDNGQGIHLKSAVSAGFDEKKGKNVVVVKNLRKLINEVYIDQDLPKRMLCKQTEIKEKVIELIQHPDYVSSQTRIDGKQRRHLIARMVER